MKHPIPDLIHSYIRKLNIWIDTLRIQEVSARHPLPHSLRSISDVLDELGDITNYVYSYQLRPASVMFKIKFSLR